MADYVRVSDQYALAVAAGAAQNEVVPMPKMAADFVCWERGPDGTPRVAWQQRMDNLVVNQGRVHMHNVLMGLDRASTNGPFAFLHNATLGSGNVYSQISGSVLTSLANGATSTNFALLTWGTTYKNASDSGISSFSQSLSWQVLSGPQTVSGGGYFFYTSASCATNAATADIRLFAYGSFAATQQLVSNNSVSATVTLNYA